jgi:ankyrin repeat protein
MAITVWGALALLFGALTVFFLFSSKRRKMRKVPVPVCIAIGCACFVTALIVLLRVQSNEALHRVVRSGSVDEAAALIAKSPELLKTFDRLGVTPLHAAAWEGREDMVQLLLKKGVDANIPGDDGSTPLYCAAIQGHLGVARILLANGADPTIKAKGGLNALDLARRHGHAELAELLSQAVDKSQPKKDTQ